MAATAAMITSSPLLTTPSNARAAAGAAASLFPSPPRIRPCPSSSRRLAASSCPSPSVPRHPPSSGRLRPSVPAGRDSSSTNHLHRLVCRVSEYKFPDPIPEFAETETDKFRTHMLERLAKKKDYFGDSIVEVVDVCTEIFSNFLHTEYGGPGTLLVIPFIDMADTLREKGLPGAPQAARAAVVWAQKHVDKDWNLWTGGEDQKSD